MHGGGENSPRARVFFFSGVFVVGVRALVRLTFFSRYACQGSRKAFFADSVARECDGGATCYHHRRVRMDDVIFLMFRTRGRAKVAGL